MNALPVRVDRSIADDVVRFDVIADVRHSIRYLSTIRNETDNVRYRSFSFFADYRMHRSMRDVDC